MDRENKEQSPAQADEVRPAKKSGLRPEMIGVGLLAVGLLTAGILPRMQQHQALAQEVTTTEGDLNKPTVEVASLPLPPKEDSGKDVSADSLLLPASIQAIEETAINARTTGYLRRRYVDIGSRVRAGQILAEIESPEVEQQLSQAEADSAKSQAGTNQATADAARLEATVAQSTADIQKSKASLEQAKAANKRSLAMLAQAKVAVASAQAKQASVAQAIEAKKADVTQLRAQLALDEKDRERWQDLGKQGAVAQQQVDAKETAYQARLASITAAEAAVVASQADLDAAKQAVEAARAGVEQARADVAASEEQIRAASSQVASSQAGLQASKASAAAGRANIRAAQAQALSSNANVRRYAVLRDFSRVTAPFSGIVTARNVDSGALITVPTGPTATPLFTLARTDTLRILVNIPQSSVRSVHVSGTVDVLIKEFPGRSFTGTVYSTAGALDTQTRTLLTEIHVPNEKGVLLPGMYAQVRFPAPAHSAGISGQPRIPAEALISDADGTRVASVTEKNTIHFLPVTISRDFGTTLEVADGLKGVERLILNPTDDLKEGATVNPVAADTASPTASPTPGPATGNTEKK